MLFDFYYKIGFAVCQQLPERTIHINGLKMPVDARETGIFIGFLITLVFLSIAYAKAQELPPKHVLVLGGLFTALLVIDGLTSYAGLRQTTNNIRLFTGLSVGSFLALILYPVYNETKMGTLNKKVISSMKSQILLLAFLVLAFVIIIAKLSVLVFILPTLIIIGIISAFLVLNQTILNQFFTRKGINWVLSLLLTILELTATYQFHFFINSLK